MFMGLFNGKRQVDCLNDYLDRERHAILAGNLASLERLIPEKIRLVSSLKTESPDASVLLAVKVKSLNNNAMLAAAAQGIQKAKQRLEKHPQPGSQLQIYDESGNRKLLGNPDAKLEIRA